VSTSQGQAEKKSGEPRVSPTAWWARQLKLHAYVPETLVLVGVMAVLNLAFLPGRPGFLGIEPNPFWAPILLMLVRYGFRAGLLSSLVCAATYMLLVSLRVKEEVITLRDLFTLDYARPAVLFVLAGAGLGMLVQRHKDRIRQLEQENARLATDNERLKRGEEALRDVNVELANRVIGATDTLPMLYRYAKRLNVLDVNQIFTVLTELLVEVIKATKGSVYLLEGQRLVLHSQNGQPASRGPELRLEPELLEEIITRRKVITLHDLLGRSIRRKDLFLCGPLSAGVSGKVLGLLVVEELEFLRYNPATVRLFGVIVDWACASLEKAAEYRGRPEARRMEEARTSLLRAQRASLPPGAITAEMFRGSVAGGIGEGVPRPNASLAPVAGGLSPQGSSGMGPVGAGALGRLLDAASEKLFGEISEGDAPPIEGLVEEDPGSVAALQHMLSGELQIASTHGSPLAKLLAEINGYVSDRSGGKP
jgi:hypothetical protein